MRKPILLLVDDDPAVLEALEAELTPEFGEICRIEAFDDPTQVLAAMPDWAKRARPIALAIVDQKMPGLMGTDLLRALCDWVGGQTDVRPDADPAAHLRAALLTGFSGLEPAVLAKNMGGVDRYLEKPWSSRGLIEACRELLGAYLKASGAGRFFAFREVRDPAELQEWLDARYADNRRSPCPDPGLQSQPDGFDVEPYDLISRFFGLVRTDEATQRVVGGLRVTEQHRGPAADSLETLVKGSPALSGRLHGPRVEPLPMLSYLLDGKAVSGLYWRLRKSGEHAVEVGRANFAPDARLGAADIILLARHALAGVVTWYLSNRHAENVFTTCPAPQQRLFAEFGFAPAASTRPRFHPTHGCELACLHGRAERLPPQTRFLLQPLAARLQETGSACLCDAYPECAADQYVRCEFREGDLFCPEKAHALVTHARSSDA